MTTKEQQKIVYNLLIAQNLPADITLLDYVEDLKKTHDDKAIFGALTDYLHLKQVHYAEWLEPIVYDKIVKNNPNVIQIEYNKQREGFKPYLYIGGFKNRHNRAYLIYEVNGTTGHKSRFRMAWDNRMGGTSILATVLDHVMKNWSQDITWSLYDIAVNGLVKVGVDRSVYKFDPKVTLSHMLVDLAGFVK